MCEFTTSVYIMKDWVIAFYADVKEKYFSIDYACFISHYTFKIYTYF